MAEAGHQAAGISIERPITASGRRPRVLIIGGGFAGVRAAKELSRSPVDVTLVDKTNHYTFQPLLYQVALAVLSPAHIATPIRSILRKCRNVTVMMDEAIGIDAERRIAKMKSGNDLSYDYLILATGATHSYFGHSDWQASAPGLKTIEDATEIRRRLLLAFELAERQAVEQGKHTPLQFIVVGAGPTGVELAGAISELAAYFTKNEFMHIDPALTHVLLIEGGPRILPSYPEDLSAMAMKQLESLGVHVMTAWKVTGIEPGTVTIESHSGESRCIDSVVTLWGAGVAASPLGRDVGKTDHRGGVLINETLNPEGRPEVFVCGDLAHFDQDGRQVPGVAQPAMQMGTHAAKMIRADLERSPRTPFRYFDKGDMATIGRFSAVADIKWPFRAHWGGLPAWLTWLFIHLVFIIDNRSRMAVLVQWGWTYIFQKRGSRLITGNLELPGWTGPQGAPTGASGQDSERAEARATRTGEPAPQPTPA